MPWPYKGQVERGQYVNMQAPLLSQIKVLVKQMSVALYHNTGMRHLAVSATSSTCCHCSRPKLHSARYKQFTSAYTQRVHTNKRRCHRRVSAQTDNGGGNTPSTAAATPAPRDDDVRLLFRSSFRHSSSFLAVLPSSVAIPGLTR